MKMLEAVNKLVQKIQAIPDSAIFVWNANVGQIQAKVTMQANKLWLLECLIILLNLNQFMSEYIMLVWWTDMNVDWIE